MRDARRSIFYRFGEKEETNKYVEYLYKYILINILLKISLLFIKLLFAK
jgi:hypothetical protein